MGEKESRWWERGSKRERGDGSVCKRERVRESRWWERELEREIEREGGWECAYERE